MAFPFVEIQLFHPAVFPADHFLSAHLLDLAQAPELLTCQQDLTFCQGLKDSIHHVEVCAMIRQHLAHQDSQREPKPASKHVSLLQSFL